MARGSESSTTAACNACLFYITFIMLLIPATNAVNAAVGEQVFQVATAGGFFVSCTASTVAATLHNLAQTGAAMVPEEPGGVVAAATLAGRVIAGAAAGVAVVAAKRKRKNRAQTMAEALSEQSINAALRVRCDEATRAHTGSNVKCRGCNCHDGNCTQRLRGKLLNPTREVLLARTELFDLNQTKHAESVYAKLWGFASQACHAATMVGRTVHHAGAAFYVAAAVPETVPGVEWFLTPRHSMPTTVGSTRALGLSRTTSPRRRKASPTTWRLASC